LGLEQRQARNGDQVIQRDKDKTNICRVWSIYFVTGSLEKTADMVAKLVCVEMAEYGMSIKEFHTFMKTYFLKKRSGKWFRKQFHWQH
jgi:hypothetical protein